MHGWVEYVLVWPGVSTHNTTHTNVSFPVIVRSKGHRQSMMISDSSCELGPAMTFTLNTIRGKHRRTSVPSDSYPHRHFSASSVRTVRALRPEQRYAYLGRRTPHSTDNGYTVRWPTTIRINQGLASGFSMQDLLTIEHVHVHVHNGLYSIHIMLDYGICTCATCL